MLVAVGVLGSVACGGSAASIGNENGNGNGNGQGNDGGGFDSALGVGDDGGTTGNDAGSDAKSVTRIPTNHRASATPCSHDRGVGTADPQIMNPDCAKDADCTTGTNGRCLVTTVAAHLNYCSYDTCFADTDCGGIKVCTCREFPSDANRCAPGNCKVDADCGPKGYCSPSVDFDKTNFGVTGYWCHTAADECANDSDCTDSNGHGKCAYNTQSATWKCSSALFLPP